jgi:anti-sigma regulatory factor (Ser/Thr protein kinase)
MRGPIAPNPVKAGSTILDRSYPGTADQIRRVRADVAALVADCPVADELVLVVSELSTNAVLHSRSRARGGQFTVRLDIRTGDYVWAEVEDQGCEWTDPEHDDRPHGLDIVAAIAGDGNWGVDGGSPTGHTVWVRLDWTDQS